MDPFDVRARAENGRTMPDANTLALVSVIGATSTAIAVPLINGYFQGRADRRRYEHERKATDLDELRELLDGSAATAFKFTNKLVTLERLAARDDARGNERYEELAAMRTELYNDNARLVIRLGRENDTVKAFGEWLRSVDHVMADYHESKAPRTEPFVPGQRQIEEWEREHWRAYEGYIDAAQTLVASPLALSCP
jgi:hypothetical protein